MQKQPLLTIQKQFEVIVRGGNPKITMKRESSARGLVPIRLITGEWLSLAGI